MKKLLILCFAVLIVSQKGFSQNNEGTNKPDKLKLNRFEADGDSKFEKKEYYDAIKLYDEAIKVHDQSSYTFFMRGLSKLKVNQFAGAVIDLTKSISLSPTNQNGYWAKGSRLEKLEDFYFLSCIEGLSKEYKYYDAYYFRGFAKYYMEDYYGAIDDMNLFLTFEKTNSNPICYYIVGISNNKLGKNNEALVYLSKVIELEPENADALLARGKVNIKLGNKENGCKDLSKAGQLGKEEAYEIIKKSCQ
jgi:tetratricopeptide (TPR) repeat protein